MSAGVGVGVSVGATPMKSRRGGPGFRLALVLGAALVVLAAMALDTRVVRIGSPADVQSAVFSAAAWGRSEFPKVQAAIEARAVEAAVLAAALRQDQAAAETRYGVAADAGAEMAVRFTGQAGKQESGVYEVSIAGVPDTVHVSVQTGPAINGTDLRDATGLVSFGQFRNQIDYQNAGSALNAEMKRAVTSKAAAGELTGRTVSVVGVFQLTDADDWVVTPVRLEVR